MTPFDLFITNFTFKYFICNIIANNECLLVPDCIRGCRHERWNIPMLRWFPFILMGGSFGSSRNDNSKVEYDNRKLILETELEFAIERNQFVLHYQPLIDVKRGSIIGMEALIRWQHPQLGLISPAEFIPLAEKSDMIKKIGEWVLYTSSWQNKKWQDQGFMPVSIAVNISALHFQDPGFSRLVKRVLHKTGIDPTYLEIEITENCLLSDISTSIRTMEELKELGVRIAIDDFGTGYSTFNYLKLLPIDALKIDRTFIRDLENDANGQLIVAAIINLVHDLGIKVIAEGVETKEASRLLVEKNCDALQGYLFSRPVIHTEAVSFIREPNNNYHMLIQ